MRTVIFFHMPEVEDTLVWDITGAGKINGEDFVLSEMEKRYQLGLECVSGGREAALCMFVKLREIIYGGWIYLDDVAEQLSEDVQYKQASFFFLLPMPRYRRTKT